MCSSLMKHIHLAKGLQKAQAGKVAYSQSLIRVLTFMERPGAHAADMRTKTQCYRPVSGPATHAHVLIAQIGRYPEGMLTHTPLI